jgi:3-methylcrotonyl-CoA carboxylase alpha subunit
VDTGVESGDEITVHYDALLAKIIVHADDRATAVRRMERALARTAVLGVATGLPFLRAVLAHPVFRRGEAGTAFVRRDMADWGSGPVAPPPDEAFVAAAIADLLGGAAAAGGPTAGIRPPGPWDRLDGFRPGGG